MVDFTKYSPQQIDRLETLISNETERAKFIDKAKDKKGAQEFIEAYRQYKGEDIKRIDPRMVLPALDALGFGYGQELLSGGLAATDVLRGKSDFQSAYKKYLETAERGEKEYTDKYGGMGLISEIAGGVPTGGLLLKGAQKVLKPASTGLGKIRQAILEGGVLGGIYESGRRSEDRAAGLKEGAIGGAIVSPLAIGATNLATKVLPTETIGRAFDRLRGKQPLEEPIVKEALETVVRGQGGRGALVEDVLDPQGNVVGSKFRDDTPLAARPSVVEQVRPELTKDFSEWTNFKDTLKSRRDNELNKSIDNIFTEFSSVQPIKRNENELYLDYLARIGKSNLSTAMKKYDDLSLGKKITTQKGFVDDFRNFLDNDIFNDLSASTKARIKAVTSSGNNKRTVFKIDEDGIKLKDGFSMTDIDNATVEKLYRALRDSRNASLKSVDSIGRVDADLIQSRNLVQEIDDLMRKYTPDIEDARMSYRKAFDIDDLTKEGNKLFKSTNSDEFLSKLRQLRNEGDEDKISAFIRGAGQKISAELQGKSKINFLNQIERGDTPYARMFIEIFPEDKIDDVIADIEKTNRFTGSYGVAQKYAAKEQFIAEDDLIKARRINKEDIVRDAINNFIPKGLTDVQRKRLSDILLEETPDTIMRNIDKPGYTQALTEYLRNRVTPAFVATVQSD